MSRRVERIVTSKSKGQLIILPLDASHRTRDVCGVKVVDEVDQLPRVIFVRHVDDDEPQERHPRWNISQRQNARPSSSKVYLYSPIILPTTLFCTYKFVNEILGWWEGGGYVQGGGGFVLCKIGGVYVRGGGCLSGGGPGPGGRVGGMSGIYIIEAYSRNEVRVLTIS